MTFPFARTAAVMMALTGLAAQAADEPAATGSGFWGRGGGKEFVDDKWKKKNGTVGPDGSWTANPPVVEKPERPPHKPHPEFPGTNDNDRGRDGYDRYRDDRYRRPIIIHKNAPDIIIQQNLQVNPMEMFTAPLRADQLTNILQPPTALLGRNPMPIIVLNPAQPVYLSRLSANGRGKLTDAYHRAMYASVGQAVIWQDMTTLGEIRVTMEGYAGSLFCRDLQHTVTMGGARYVATASACRDPGSFWRLGYLSS